MAKEPNAPRPEERFVDIVASMPREKFPDGWDPGVKQKIPNLTRGDLMRLGGWMPRDYKGAPIPALSEALKPLTVADLHTLAEVLEAFNDMDYGTSMYFCCTCM